MRRELTFSINQQAVPGAINPGTDNDPVNGFNAEFLGIFKIDNKNLMISKILNPASPLGHREEIKVNEVEFDMHYNGSMELYYSYSKDHDIEAIEQLLNSDEAKSLMTGKVTIYQLFNILGIGYKESPMDGIVLRNFERSRGYVFPTDYDYKREMDECYGEGRYESEPTEISMYKMHATGISPTAFQSLKDVKDFCKKESHSFYGNAYQVKRKRFGRK